MAQLAREVAGGILMVFLDCDPEGENGVKQCLGYLAEFCPVRLAWSPKKFGGMLNGYQPESLRIDEWQEIDAFLRRAKEDGWSLS